MALQILIVTAAAKASLALNENSVRKSFERLSSGKRLTSSTSRFWWFKKAYAAQQSKWSQANVQNATSFQVQDGALFVGQIIDRMSELKGCSQDPRKL